MDNEDEEAYRQNGKNYNNFNSKTTNNNHNPFSAFSNAARPIIHGLSSVEQKKNIINNNMRGFVPSGPWETPRFKIPISPPQVKPM